MVESIFRSAKSLLETRPIYHKVDDTIRGHVFCSFLALVLRKELETRLEKQGEKLEWADINRDLRALQEVEVEMQGKKLYLRTDLRGGMPHGVAGCGSRGAADGPRMIAIPGEVAP
jgi:hypothetical protein